MRKNKGVPPASGRSGEEIEGISGAPIATYELRSWNNDVYQEHWTRGAAERQERRRQAAEVRREIAGTRLKIADLADELARPVDNINGNLGVLPDAAARKAVIERLASAILADRFDALGGVILLESYEPRTPKMGADMREVWARFHREGWGNAAADHNDWLRFHVETAYITREAVARFVRDNAYPWPKSLGAEPQIAPMPEHATRVSADAVSREAALPVSAEQPPRVGTAADLESTYRCPLGRSPITEDEWRKQPDISITRTRMRELRAKFVPAEIKKGARAR